MEYKVEPIGAQFSSKDIGELEKLFTSRCNQGYRLHSIIQVQQPQGCLGTGSPTQTLLAIYEKTDQLKAE